MIIIINVFFLERASPGVDFDSLVRILSLCTSAVNSLVTSVVVGADFLRIYFPKVSGGPIPRTQQLLGLYLAYHVFRC